MMAMANISKREQSKKMHDCGKLILPQWFLAYVSPISEGRRDAEDTLGWSCGLMG